MGVGVGLGVGVGEGLGLGEGEGVGVSVCEGFRVGVMVGSVPLSVSGVEDSLIESVFKFLKPEEYISANTVDEQIKINMMNTTLIRLTGFFIKKSAMHILECVVQFSFLFKLKLKSLNNMLYCCNGSSIDLSQGVRPNLLKSLDVY